MLKLRELRADKGYYPTVTRQLEEFLYILKEHVENNLFVKYYLRMANFNKVINGLNIKSTVCLQWTPMGNAIETTHSMVFRNRMHCLDCPLAEVHCEFVQILYLEPS